MKQRISIPLLGRVGHHYSISVMSLAIQRTLAYRARYLTSALIGFVQIGILYYIWGAIYADSGQLGGYNWQQIRTYLFLTYVLNLFVTFMTETQMSSSIRDGSIIMELVKPVRYLRLRLFDTMGTALVEGVAIGAVATVLAIFLFHIASPSIEAIPLFLAAFVAAFLLRFLLAVTTGLLCFWTTSVLGLIWARQAIAMLFSGALVPLALLPNWLATIALWLPFQGTVHTPVALYLGRITGGEAVLALLVQLVWITILWFAAVKLLQRGLGKVDVFGG